MSLNLVPMSAFEQPRHGLRDRSRAGAGERGLRALGVVERLHLGGVPLHEDVVAGGDPADIGELRRVVLHGGIGERLFERGGFDHDPERRAVLGRDLVEIVRGLEAAGARHVLRDQRRLSGNVLAQMARHHAAVEIVAAARGVADGDRDGLAGEEWLGRLRGGLFGQQQQRNRQRSIQ